jgi:hypothetical protein
VISTRGPPAKGPVAAGLVGSGLVGASSMVPASQGGAVGPTA